LVLHVDSLPVTNTKGLHFFVIVVTIIVVIIAFDAIFRNEKLEAEAKSAAEKFDEITKKWEYALSKEIPQDLHAVRTIIYY